MPDPQGRDHRGSTLGDGRGRPVGGPSVRTGRSPAWSGRQAPTASDRVSRDAARRTGHGAGRPSEGSWLPQRRPEQDACVCQGTQRREGAPHALLALAAPPPVPGPAAEAPGAAWSGTSRRARLHPRGRRRTDLERGGDRQGPPPTRGEGSGCTRGGVRHCEPGAWQRPTRKHEAWTFGHWSTAAGARARPGGRRPAHEHRATPRPSPMVSTARTRRPVAAGEPAGGSSACACAGP